MKQEQIDRINELARKAKTPEGLTEAERAEQAVLRRAYIDSVLGISKASWTTPTSWTSRGTSGSWRRKRRRAEPWRRIEKRRPAEGIGAGP